MSVFDKGKQAELIKFVKFGFTGLLNTAVDFGVFTLLGWLGLGVYLSQVLSYSAGIANSYVINRSWTFSSKERFFSPQLLKFIIVNLLLLGLSLGVLYVFHDLLGLHKMIAKLIATGFTVVLGFVVNRLWVFQ